MKKKQLEALIRKLLKRFVARVSLIPDFQAEIKRLKKKAK